MKKHIKELEHNASYLRFITDHTNDLVAICELDPGFTYTYISPSHAQLGYTPEELIGSSGTNIIHPDDLMSLLKIFDEVMQDPDVPHWSMPLEFRVLDKEGNWHDLESSAFLWKGEADARGSMVLISRDITESKRMKMAKVLSDRRYRLLFNNVMDATIIHEFTEDGRPGRIIEVNDAACQLLGYERKVLLGMLPQELISSGERETFRKLLENLMENRHGLFESVQVTRDGVEIPVEISVNIFEMDGQLLAHSSIRDISQRKAYEDALKRSSGRMKRLNTLIRIKGEMWKMASEQGLTENELIHRSLEIAGEHLDATQAIFYERVGKDHVPIVTWQRGGGDASDTAHLPATLVDHLFSGQVMEQEPGEVLMNCPEHLKEDAGVFVKLLGQMGTSSFAGAMVNGGRIRKCSIRFDRGASGDDRSSWTAGEISLIQDIAQVLSRTISQRQVERELNEAKENLELRVETRTKELHDSNTQLVDQIAQRQMVDEALKESEKKLKGILSSLHETSIILMDRKGRVLLAWGDEKLGSRYGMTIEDVQGNNVLDMSPDNPAKKDTMERIRKLFEGGGSFREETQFHAPNGNFWFDVTYSPLRGDSGKVEAVVGFIRDITSLKSTEMALKEEKERLSITLKSIGDGVIAMDVHGRIVLMNRAAEQMSGLSNKDATGMKLEEVLGSSGENSAYAKIFERIMEDHEPHIYNRDLVLRSDAKEQRVVRLNGAPLLNTSGEITGVVIIVSDVTERKKLEEETQKVQRLKSVGLLAGGIAHDFNNILTSILGNITMAKMRTGEVEDVVHVLAEAEKAAIKAQKLTEQLLTFSKGGAPIKRTVDLGPIIRESAEFALSGSNVKCECTIDEGLWPVSCDEGQISQVIHNLVINADQAMPNGGAIRIGARNLSSIGEGTAAFKDGPHVEISVTDRGKGISAELLEKVFDPYFTTKDTGSGLGLATSFSIIKRHEGHLTATSTMGEGSTFTFDLPAIPGARLDLSEEMEEAQGGKGRILFMDDDELIREMVQELLEDLGYDVVFAEEGRRVIELYKEAMEGGNNFDVVILDLTIPGKMGGKKTMSLLLDIDPGVKAIVSSGYSNDPIMANFGKYGFSAMVAKPYRVQELSRVIRKVMSNE